MISNSAASFFFFFKFDSYKSPQLHGSTLLNCWSAPINVQKIFLIQRSTSTQALQQRLSVEQEILNFSGIL